MSFVKNFMARRIGLFPHNIDTKEQNMVWERQKITDVFNDGVSLPKILDQYSSSHNFEDVDGDPNRGVVVFGKTDDTEVLTQRYRTKDGMVLYEYEGTGEAIAISYDREYLRDDMEKYWV